MAGTASSDVPKFSVEEYETEGLMRGCKILLCEGPSDEETVQRWLVELEIDIAVVEIDKVNIERDHSFDEWGNRDRVVAASRTCADLSRVKCLIDRDLSGGPQSEDPEALLFTDFPGLESYILTDAVVRRLLWHFRRVQLDKPTPALSASEIGRRLSKGVTDLTRDLASILAPLFDLRGLHRSESTTQSFPEDLKKMTHKRTGVLDVPKTALAAGISSTVDGVSDGAGIDTLEDLRPVAYGHDIARALFVLWGDLRVKHGVLSPDHLEKMALSFVRGEDVANFALLESLRVWGGS